jgi:hypothetical protein
MYLDEGRLGAHCCTHGDEDKDGSSRLEHLFVRCFGCRSGRTRVLAAYADTGQPATNGEAPEESLQGPVRAVSCGDDDDTGDDAERRDDDAVLAAVQVADDADSELAEDGADRERVGQTGRDRARVLFAIDLTEDDVRKSHDCKVSGSATDGKWVSLRKMGPYCCSANHRR